MWFLLKAVKERKKVRGRMSKPWAKRGMEQEPAPCIGMTRTNEYPVDIVRFTKWTSHAKKAFQKDVPSKKPGPQRMTTVPMRASIQTA